MSMIRPSVKTRSLWLAAWACLKPMTAVVALLAAFTLSIQTSVRADTFGSGTDTFTIDFVRIGSAGNAADTTGYGAVPYEYRVGAYEVTQDAVTKAMASGLADVTAGEWTGNQPVAPFSWYEAAAFVNWLNTSSGKTAAYDLTFSSGSWSMALWSSEQAWTAGGTNLYRNKNAFYFLPSENEWYKAAYYNAAGTNYFLYPTASNTDPIAVASGTDAGTAVYNFAGLQPAAVTNAGGLSPVLTMGQGGNVSEWMESAFDGTNSSASQDRAILGGNYQSFWYPGLTTNPCLSSARGIGVPSNEIRSVGFRVASVPEPSTYALMVLAGLACGGWQVFRRRQTR
jgi:formylglycine-generating enzyme